MKSFNNFVIYGFFLLLSTLIIEAVDNLLKHTDLLTAPFYILAFIIMSYGVYKHFLDRLKPIRIKSKNRTN